MVSSGDKCIKCILSCGLLCHSFVCLKRFGDCLIILMSAHKLLKWNIFSLQKHLAKLKQYFVTNVLILSSSSNLFHENVKYSQILYILRIVLLYKPRFKRDLIKYSILTICPTMSGRYRCKKGGLNQPHIKCPFKFSYAADFWYISRYI